LQKQTNICGTLEAKLEMAEKVLAYCNYNVQITMQILIRGAADIESLLAQRADNSAEIARLIEQLQEKAESEEEKQLLEAASPRWSFAEYYGELLRQVVDGRQAVDVQDSGEARAETTNIMLPLLLDNASWKAFVEFLRAQMSLAEPGNGSSEALIGRTRDLVRQNHILKSAVAERTRLQERLSQLSSIIDCANDAIVIYTVGGTIVGWNAAAERVYGYRANEVLGRSRYMLRAQHQQDEVLKISEKLKRQERVGLCEAIHIRKNGKEIRVSMSLSPVKDASGKVVGFAAITREMSDSSAPPRPGSGKRDSADV
jgi:PAS domain S-box-containing protein